MASAAVVGCTGLVGSHILSTLLSHPSTTNVHALCRRALPYDPDTPKLHPHICDDPFTFPSQFSAITPPPSILLSALGTSRAIAGSFEKQRKVDYDLNLAIAKAAKARGVKVYVLISSAGVSTSSLFAYAKMKAELEEAVVALDFDHTVIVKPGLLLGAREESRPAEAALRALANVMGAVSGGALKDFWAQDADVIARAAVVAGLKALNEGGDKVVAVDQATILRMGKPEWKELEVKPT